MLRYLAPKYEPHNTHMSNVVKTAGCKPLFRKPRYWLRRLFAAFVTVIVFVCFFAALFIIAEAVK
jgi:lipopolysaccharide/colanic/teichoic acid biosynthesis glycosyltransferase